MIRAPLCPAASRIEGIPSLWAASRPDAVALRDALGSYSWRQLEGGRDALAAELRALGVRAGDRVMIVGENCAALVPLLFAVAALDAWFVNVNARLAAREVDAIRAHCTPRCTVFLSHASPEAAAHAARHGALALATAGWGALERSPVDACCVPEPVEASPDRQVAALVYTTGTTGEPKGVMLTHASILFIARRAVELRGLTPEDRVVGVLPFSHVYGLSSVCMGSLLAGSAIHVQPRFSPAALERAFAEERVTLCQGVPAMYAKFLDFLAGQGRTLRAPALRAIYCGGSPLSPAVKRQVEEAFGLPLHNGYGLTEASPTVTQTRPEAPRGDCSVGHPLPGVEVRIVGAQGEVVAAGAPGELWVRGPNVMKGYYRDAAATAAALRPGGWLATGDIARQAPDGALFIEGRLKELIIRSGFNVYPVEVEAVLNAHPAVSQSAVVGREVEGNEEVVAFVELAPGALASPAELAAHAAAALAPYKRPAEVIVLEHLPAAPSGKVLKGTLREMARARARAPGD